METNSINLKDSNINLEAITPDAEYWCSQKIHQLRLRFGWSKSDLARRLNLNEQDILKWENSEASPDDQTKTQLAFLEKQLESISDEILANPIAEVQLEQNLKTQILLDELI